MVSGPESITVGVRDIDAALAVFGGHLGMQIESDTRASVSLLSAWRYPVHADVRLVELSENGRAFGRVRLARYETAPGTHPPDPGIDAPARAQDMGTRGADFHTHTPVERGLRALGIDVSMVNDTGETRRFYGEVLGLRSESLRFVETTTAPQTRTMAPGQLGINLFSLRCDDLDVLEAKLRSLDVQISTRPTHVALGNGAPARVMLVRGPNLELLEFIERSE